jgi:hypothetical protein
MDVFMLYVAARTVQRDLARTLQSFVIAVV